MCSDPYKTFKFLFGQEHLNKENLSSNVRGYTFVWEMDCQSLYSNIVASGILEHGFSALALLTIWAR